VGEVWALAFCEEHGLEAECAALEESAGSVAAALEGFTAVERERWPINDDVVSALEGAKRAASSASLGSQRIDYEERDRLMRAAYGPLEAMRAHTDEGILLFDYAAAEHEDTPYDWWSEERLLVVKFMRQASDLGAAFLLHELERLREYATVQQLLAEEDYERRHAELRRRRARPREHAPAHEK
jgi:hypothetical protein